MDAYTLKKEVAASVNLMVVRELNYMRKSKPNVRVGLIEINTVGLVGGERWWRSRWSTMVAEQVEENDAGGAGRKSCRWRVVLCLKWRTM